MSTAQDHSSHWNSHNSGSQIANNSGTVNNNFNQGSDSNKALAHLFITDPDVDRHNLLAEKGCRVPGTCDWLLQDPDYLAWINSDSSSLWLSGGPGKGKTMLALRVIDALLTKTRDLQQDCTVLYFFCSEQDSSRNNAIAIVRGLLWQFIKRRQHLEAHCLPYLRKENYQQTIVSFGSLWSIFVNMLEDKNSGDVYCIIDGIDECDPASQPLLLRGLFETFPAEGSPRSQPFKLFGVSREAGGIHFLPNHHIRLEPTHGPTVNRDVDAFISDKLKKFRDTIEDFHVIEEKVRQTLVENAQGTFLWIGLCIQELERQNPVTADDFLDLIDQEPVGLEAMYSKMLDGVKPKSRKSLPEVLRWMLVAHRPLTLRELTAALSRKDNRGISAESTLHGQLKQCRGFFQSMPGKSVNYAQRPLTSRRHCFIRDEPLKSLIIVLYDSNQRLKKEKILVAQRTTTEDVRYVQYQPRSVTEDIFVTFPHLSMRMFFIRAANEDAPIPQSLRFDKRELELKVFQECIEYLAAHGMEESSTCLNLPRVVSEHPLLNYASMNWMDHARHVTESDWGKVCESHAFFKETGQSSEINRGTKLRINWLSSYLLESDDVKYGTEVAYARTKLPLLHLACRLGLLHWAAQLMPESTPESELSQVLNKIDIGKMTPLVYAIQSGNLELCRLLLERGARPTYRAYIQTLNPHREPMLRLLIARGNFDCQEESELIGNKFMFHPLVQAVAGKFWKAAELLLDAGAQVQPHLDTMLEHAFKAPVSAKVIYGLLSHVNNWSDLMQHLFDIATSEDQHADTILHTLFEWPLVQKSLLGPATSHKTREMLMRCTAEHGLEASLDWLIQSGVDYMAKSDEGNSALIEAIGCGNQGIARMLLRRGATLSNLDKLGSDCLCLAVFHNNREGAQMLLDEGVSVNQPSEKGIPPLVFAVTSAPVDIVNFLLQNGAQVNQVDSNGQTALQRAAIWGRAQIVELLINKGAWVNATDPGGKTALHFAAVAQQRTTMEILIRSGVKENMRDLEGKTADDLLKKAQRESEKDAAPTAGMVIHATY
ncbi:hypothetical protein HBH74_226530 [Parastagonospora nodorum]|nr:hypothetical protein HBH74_226530 [Parastagonospora nodorum]KAH4935321.1 hypothetical protein HBH73_174270 [Parastagonospora nodorum]